MDKFKANLDKATSTATVNLDHVRIRRTHSHTQMYSVNYFIPSHSYEITDMGLLMLGERSLGKNYSGNTTHSLQKCLPLCTTILRHSSCILDGMNVELAMQSTGHKANLKDKWQWTQELQNIKDKAYVRIFEFHKGEKEFCKLSCHGFLNGMLWNKHKIIFAGHDLLCFSVTELNLKGHEI